MTTCQVGVLVGLSLYNLFVGLWGCAKQPWYDRLLRNRTTIGALLNSQSNYRASLATLAAILEFTERQEFAPMEAVASERRSHFELVRGGSSEHQLFGVQWILVQRLAKSSDLESAVKQNQWQARQKKVAPEVRNSWPETQKACEPLSSLPAHPHSISG